MRLSKGRAWLEARGLWAMFMYLLFGGLTTVINIVSFYALTHLGLSWQWANLLSWVAAVLFAFVTNKRWVFASHTTGVTALAWEFGKFLFARIVSLGLDYACMFALIDGLHASTVVAKVVTQVVIVVANYAFSKLVVFKGE